MTTDIDLNRDRLLSIYETMVTSRILDEKMLVLLRQGKSFFHIGASGHEAAQVGAAMAFDPSGDWCYPYYRDQAFVLQWGVTPLEVLLAFLARADDPSSGGRQLPQHYGNAEKHIVTQSSPTGTQFLQAVGTAMGLKKKGSDRIVYVSSGEGTTSQGDFYEAINWATRDQLPVIFFIQDNKYAISVPRDQQAAGKSVYDMVLGYENLHRHQVNGLDVVETLETMGHCVELARQGKGPSLVVAHTVRLLSHSSSDDQKKYREPQEIEEEQRNDPIPRLGDWLMKELDVHSSVFEDIRRNAREKVEEAAEIALNSPMPDPATVERHLFSVDLLHDNPEPPRFLDEKPIAMVDAINHALREAMEEDDSILLFGQDVADKKGGVFTATRGLSSDFGQERVFNSPLAESSIVGTAIGLTVAGYRPVIEIQFGDYIWTAMMQIRNELSTFRWRSNGSFACPVVVRVPVGGYIHGGLCHSQNIEAFLAHIPGLQICYPSNAADAKGLLRQAIDSPDPVMFLEHKGLYRQSYAMRPEPEKGYRLPFGRAVVVHAGEHLTVVTWGALLHRSMNAAKRLAKNGVSVEVIDLCTIAPLDMTTVYQSIEKTGRVIIVHEDTLTAGFGAEVAARIARHAFENLDAPVMRIAAKDTPIPYNWDLEAAVLPQESDLEKAMIECVRY